MTRLNAIVAVLFVAVFVNAIAVVYIKQQSRALYGDIRYLQKQQDDLAIEWGRLQIQHSTLVNHAFVEKVAREKLGMKSVQQPKYLVLQ
ncbi:MAG: cell division protein FtsL [Gammaproteobacteria bacterium]|nr:cell division protein FtsL [Gammaproteobacteria bacterium]